MREDSEHIVMMRGQCDICSRFTWVSGQYLGGVLVSAQCKRCNKQVKHTEEQIDEQDD